MMRIRALLPILALAACGSPQQRADAPAKPDEPRIQWNADSLILPDEKHFKHLRKLTFGGDNAEAYWSFVGDRLTFQATNPVWDDECDQIHVFNPFRDDLQHAMPPRLSSNGGRTTCSYFLPGDSLVLYASTHLAGRACPPVPEHRPGGKYLWPIYANYDIFVSDLHGNIRRRLTETPGYDAEATVSPKGDRIVFTSVRDGDLDLYTMNIDGSDVRRVTNTLGYDGGAFFSPDGSKLVWRASRPTTPEDIKEYKDLLAQALVQPTEMELWIANADGTDAHQVTHYGKANWAPYWHPSGSKLIFSTNHDTERGFPFTLYLINTDGTGLERVSYGDTFDAFPVFSADGHYLVFSSNRGGSKPHETNLFMAEWAE